MRPRFISIPTFRHFFEWLKSRLDEKANAVHEHAEYLSELPLPLTKIGETDGQMTYDGQVVTGGGGGEPAWGEYGQFKKVIVDAGISTRVPAFYDFVRDHYAYQPGMYVFLTKPNPTATMAYSEDGVMVTKVYEGGIWHNLSEEGSPMPPFAIADIPNMFAEMLEEMPLLVYDNLELEGEPIASFGRTDLPAFTRSYEIAYATIYNRFNDYQGHLHDTSVELHLHDLGYSHHLEIDGRWRGFYSGGEYTYDGNPYPEP